MNNLIIVLIIGGIICGGLWWAIKQERREERPTINIKKVRKMAVTGSFYPTDKNILDLELSKYLTQTEKLASSSPMRILIVPHAGIIYSGLTAAWGYRQVQDNNISRVIILGVSHKFDFSTVAAITSGEWETPWGNLEIDENWAKKAKLIEDNAKHEGEHSLELQSIWIKKLWPKAKIVPILVSRPNKQEMNKLAFRIAENFDENTLLVVSTDLSHYFPYKEAVDLDKKTLESVVQGKEIESTGACAAIAVNIVQKIANLLGSEKPVIIKAENSGDTAGDKNRVVGYAAIGYEIPNTKLQIPKLNGNEQKEALEIARKTLGQYIKYGSYPVISTESAILNWPLGAFVTVKKNGNLRGCIGEFDPEKPLYQVIMEKTVAAATQDRRFESIREDELEDIELEISVMTPKKKVESWEEIRLGTDGVVMVNSNRSGTFLPQVAKETGWSKQEFMEQLCTQKAGLDKNCYLDSKTEIYVFQAQVF